MIPPSSLLTTTGNLTQRQQTVSFNFSMTVAQGKTIIIVTHDSGWPKRAERTALHRRR